MQEQDQSNDEPPVAHAPLPRRHIFKATKPLASRNGVLTSSSAPAAVTRRESAPKPRTERGRSKSGYFVYLLVGVHRSHAEAQRAHSHLPFAASLPVTYQRNTNGLGQCKTWIGISRPFERQALAQVAQRQLAPFVGEGAVRVARGDLT